jgi:hypothetical protein
VQKYWAKASGAHDRPLRMVALVRPQPPPSAETADPRQNRRGFRVTTQAPVLQTQSVISRIILRDGSLVEEALHDRFVLARTVATQTLPVELRRVCEGIQLEVMGVIREDESEASTAGTPLQDENEEYDQ